MLSTLLFLTVALGFGAMGAVALVRPARVTEQFGIERLTADGRNEVRAVYGGFGAAMALTLGTAVLVEPLRAGVGFTVGAAALGMAIGRLVSATIDRSFGRAPRLYFIIESIAASTLVYATMQ